MVFVHLDGIGNGNSEGSNGSGGRAGGDSNGNGGGSSAGASDRRARVGRRSSAEGTLVFFLLPFSALTTSSRLL